MPFHFGDENEIIEDFLKKKPAFPEIIDQAKKQVVA